MLHPTLVPLAQEFANAQTHFREATVALERSYAQLIESEKDDLEAYEVSKLHSSVFDAWAAANDRLKRAAEKLRDAAQRRLG